ncbi:MAG: hypothetical protein COS95_01725, partial [Ignavibacteriales bacterium CG07_land_8_20_14_0_80_59_12]
MVSHFWERNLKIGDDFSPHSRIVVGFAKSALAWELMPTRAPMQQPAARCRHTPAAGRQGTLTCISNQNIYGDRVMKRLLTICTALLVLSFMAGSLVDLGAQAVKVKRVAMTPGARSTGYPSYRAP